MPAADNAAVRVAVAADEAGPDGTRWLLGFTSAPEVVAHHPRDAVGSFGTAEVLDLVSRRGFGGLVVNPAGPWAALPAAELTAAPA